jgi:hypothetical protein
MILRKIQDSPQKAVPLAMMLVVAGLSLIVLATVWLRFTPSFIFAGHDYGDFVHGFLYGVAIAMEIMGAAIAAAAAVAAKARKT